MLASLRAKFWKWLMLRAFAGWCDASPEPPTGIPFLRDLTTPCVAYNPRPRRERDWAGCAGDGNLLCNVCCRRSAPDPVSTEFRRVDP